MGKSSSRVVVEVRVIKVYICCVFIHLKETHVEQLQEKKGKEITEQGHEKKQIKEGRNGKQCWMI